MRHNSVIKPKIPLRAVARVNQTLLSTVVVMAAVVSAGAQTPTPSTSVPLPVPAVTGAAATGAAVPTPSPVAPPTYPVAQRIEPIVPPVIRAAPKPIAAAPLRDKLTKKALVPAGRAAAKAAIAAAAPAVPAATASAPTKGVQSVGPVTSPAPLSVAKGKPPLATTGRSALGIRPGLLPRLKPAISRAVKFAKPAPRRAR
jgi:hypothetical protein